MGLLGGILAVGAGIAIAASGIPLSNTILLVAGAALSVIEVGWIVHDSKYR